MFAIEKKGCKAKNFAITTIQQIQIYIHACNSKKFFKKPQVALVQGFSTFLSVWPS